LARISGKTNRNRNLRQTIEDWLKATEEQTTNTNTGTSDLANKNTANNKQETQKGFKKYGD